MKDINKEMQAYALKVKEECTKLGYTMSICLADGKGHGEFYHNIEDVDYSMLRFIEKDNRIGIHFKSYMKSEPIKTDMSVNALAIMADITGMNAMTFISCMKEIEKRIEIEKDEGKIIPLRGKNE